MKSKRANKINEMVKRENASRGFREWLKQSLKMAKIK